MDYTESDHKVFEDQMRRIQDVTGKKTLADLADILGICRSSIAVAKRRGKIPANWLVTLMRFKQVNPEWILTGDGPMFFYFPSSTPRYATADEALERRADEEALRRLPSSMLADELVRRIAIAQDRAFCSKNDA